MIFRHSILRPLAIAALLLASGISQAAIQIYTSQADFLAAVSGAATDTFDDLVPGAALPAGPLARSAGAYSYTAHAGPGSDLLYGAGSAADAWLSTDAASDALTFSFGSSVRAVGFNAFGSNLAGNFIRATTLFVAASDSQGAVDATLSRTTTGTFIGFISDAQIDFVSVTARQGLLRDVWPTVNNMVLASPVPEPASYALLLSGLAAVGFVARRRRQA